MYTWATGHLNFIELQHSPLLLLLAPGVLNFRRWREEGQQKPPAPPADEPRARVPLIDPYAPATCYPVPPPEPPRLPVEPPRPQVSAPPPAPRRESFPQAKPAVSSVKAMPQPKVAVSAKPAKAEPAGESWSSKQQRLKKEQREARLAENLRTEAVCYMALALLSCATKVAGDVQQEVEMRRWRMEGPAVGILGSNHSSDKPWSGWGPTILGCPSFCNVVDQHLAVSIFEDAQQYPKSKDIRK